MRKQIGALILVIVTIAVVSKLGQGPPADPKLVWTLDGVVLGQGYESLRGRWGRPETGRNDQNRWIIGEWGGLENVVLRRGEGHEGWRVTQFCGRALALDGIVRSRVGEAWSAPLELGPPSQQNGEQTAFRIPLESPITIDGRVYRGTRLSVLHPDSRIAEIRWEVTLK